MDISMIRRILAARIMEVITITSLSRPATAPISGRFVDRDRRRSQTP